ncbi:Crp/Fnr family transcriptional regulator [Pseudobacteriovorax antillogorgiicola]|uniref:cAMP-binding domain of CRP or a regulatory subunit of cAMP-dependent protein kinases n=1 Tax=Pseudobacteriovorax antillogorgiicola TaxID=1513793 RepID=A0A1Y6BKU4_9BACT|nr:cyclic nucleotide-binding domain-containing protein [Pseudobacteriovorax antillogorgiicola]TCS56218.1 CRP-like cAMP-binding protein [Pseudobacteriovorax antillogorgiicola]SMF08417.1 cAMP-binding domain of CRP or a regulatory subunit of cAMP-dependent protein kinases [Pseudobacteriovorax antillogorgiicola]
MVETKELLQFKDGQVLFSHGDPGGDLFVIEEGQVEIYREKDTIHLTLSYMHPGEVIGLLTCLNRRPRTASAKAVGHVTVRKIPADSVKKTLKDVPPWIEIIIKEFSIRLTDLLDFMIRQQEQLESARLEQIDLTFQAQTLCGTLSTLAKYHKQDIDGSSYVALDEIQDELMDCLSLSEERIHAIIKVLQDAGLLKLEKDPDKDRHIIPYNVMVSIIDMARFIEDAKLGLTKKRAQHHFRDKTIRTARAIVVYARNMGYDTKKSITLSYDELTAHLERKAGVKFEISSLDDLGDLQLLELYDSSIQLIPHKLGRSIAHIVAYQKLRTHPSTVGRSQNAS